MQSYIFNTLPAPNLERSVCLQQCQCFCSSQKGQTESGAQTVKAAISLVSCHQHPAGALSHALPLLCR